MSNIDRQITNIFTAIHREQFGARHTEPQCRWYYDSNTDIYHCPHTAVYGKDIIARILGPSSTGSSGAWEDWQASPNRDTHPL